MADATNRIYYCPVELTADLFASRWKPTLLRYVGEGVHGFDALKRRLPLVTPKSLERILRELERDGLVERIRHLAGPRRVSFELTALGEVLCPILEQLAEFGRDYAARFDIELLSESAEADPEAEEASSAEPEDERRGRWLAWNWLPL